MFDAFVAVRTNQVPFSVWNEASAFRLKAALELAGDSVSAGDRYIP
jgi:hypothetical protein